MNITILSIAIIAAGLAAGVSSEAFAQSDGAYELDGEVNIGVVYPLTGDLGERGVQRLAAVELGAANFNDYLTSMGHNWTLVLSVEDSETKPAATLDRVTTLNAKGVKIIIGPASSTNVKHIIQYTNENNMLVLSCCSTSPDLVIPGDSVFRLAPDDRVQGIALARLIERAGIDALVPIWRQDDYGNNLVEQVRDNYETRGVMDEGIAYDPNLADYSASISLLADRVQNLADEHGADKVAVLIVSYNEIVNLVQSADSYPILKQVRWFAGESIAKASVVLNDRIAAEFVNAVNLTAFQIFENRGEKFARVTQHMVDKFNTLPATYVYQSYDAPWLIGLTMLEAGTADPTAVKAVLPDIAEEYQGALGSTKMNAAGDLLPLDLAVWQVNDGVWVEKGKYSSLKKVIIPTDQVEDDVTIGAVYPLTGDLATRGEHRLASSQLGVADFNDFVASMGYDWQLNMLEEDDATSPIVAETKVKALHAKEVNFIVGIPSSSNVKQVKQYVDSSDMLVVSCCSTSPALSIADNIFRVAPDDATQGRALAAVMEAEGIEALVSIWRNDDYGNGLAEHTHANFDGTVEEGIPYDPLLPTTSASVSLLAEKVTRLTEEHGADKVAILMIAYDESVDIVQTASNYGVMDDVRWFGAETFVGVSYFKEDPIADEFINSVNFTALFVDSQDNTGGSYERVIEHVRSVVGTDPASYVAQAYDAVWLVGLSILESGSAETVDVKNALPMVASTYSGALASTKMNEFGDLLPQDLAIWQVINSEWVEQGTYVSETGAIVPVQ